VTGLANRAALMDRLSQALVALERRPGRLAVLFVDLDHFKDVNDTFGHDTGDQVLAEVGRRLSLLSRQADIVAASAATSSSCCASRWATTTTSVSSPTGSCAGSAPPTWRTGATHGHLQRRHRRR